MFKIRRVLLALILITMVMFLFACNERTVQEIPAGPVETIEGAAAGDTVDDIEIMVQDGKKDRLPGSLKWGSVVMYASGKDFYFEQSAGLTYIYEHYSFSDYNGSDAATTITTDISLGETTQAQQTVETGPAPAQQTQAAPDPAPVATPPPPDPTPAPAPAGGSTVISNQDGYSSTSIIISDGTTFTQHSTTTIGGSSSSGGGTSSGTSSGGSNKGDDWYDW